MISSPDRRKLLTGGSMAAALAALSTLADLAHAQQGRPAKAGKRMPSIFVGHGSPMNAIQDNAFTRQLSQWGQSLGRPAAILSVSAHWLTPGQTAVGIDDKPKTIHDFGGFPDQLQQMQYPAPGAPAFARQAAALVKSAPASTSDEWGLDHGTWTVLRHMYPRADIPVFQLSIDYAQQGKYHYAIGQELAALREKGVLIMGSGNVVHNLRATERGVPMGVMASKPWAQSFDNAVRDALAARDDNALMNPLGMDASVRMAVPTPDHYWPLLYALGAAGKTEKTITTFEGFQSGTLSMRCLQWG
ncbi:MAG: 4,5-DOPA dioxygenase extradiol [Polaromonas sp.]|uniref:4,5-DOPA-extradiol-dioxygenase n=1 Tax=Polaromonas sp. TaxID=1869339 RepID=UPI0025EB4571|nr:4,5-DOPA dioxygenase extradiol [Polaromonas sp.]MBI2728362.1 4,5-DOPA dioxygenase extradiol [Polaromonas sp.]